MQLGSPYCKYCGDIIETELHVLWDCLKCMNVWLNCVEQERRELFFNSDLKHLITLNLNGGIGGIGIENWPSYWALACNKDLAQGRAYDDSFNRPRNPNMSIAKYVKEYGMATTVNQVVVNTDGVKEGDGRCGCGKIIRGRSIEWLSGFAKGLGICSVLVAEMWGALEGLRCAWRMGVKRVELCVTPCVSRICFVTRKECVLKDGACAIKLEDY
ncbi:RNA-directed DNA polymerase (Reverse transcriptase) [Trifolium medium]|uniref:RNA-directed DNA polymerase (Reverse transcriptase) n=1 Tax=Trifolium medium TaxID=97028 RepID=A0A392LYL7_9FABA|nr:RNA-directed DNA polymerase (Reverse transcriptase) [Trifolium medium]